jgi:GT2 family glycosyltransferase
MKTSIITALFNKLDLTQEFWASLEAHPPSGEWEIIWIDDGSTDGTRQWLTTLQKPRHRVILNDRNLGYAASNNRGAQAATGEILALLNNDLVLTPGWFAPMHAALAEHPQAGVVGNVQLNARTGEVDHSGVFYYARGKPTHDRTLPLGSPPVRPVIAATAACILISKTRFDAMRGFDERFINGCEDVDLCLRLHTAGWQNYVALTSIVRHHVSASPGRSVNNARNTFLLMQRWRPLIPSFAAQSWADPALRDRWESKLIGWRWLAAYLTRRWRRRPGQPCPAWLQSFVPRFIDQELARSRQTFPHLASSPANPDLAWPTPPAPKWYDPET